MQMPRLSSGKGVRRLPVSVRQTLLPCQNDAIFTVRSVKDSATTIRKAFLEIPKK